MKRRHISLAEDQTWLAHRGERKRHQSVHEESQAKKVCQKLIDSQSDWNESEKAFSNFSCQAESIRVKRKRPDKEEFSEIISLVNAFAMLNISDKPLDSPVRLAKRRKIDEGVNDLSCPVLFSANSVACGKHEPTSPNNSSDGASNGGFSSTSDKSEDSLTTDTDECSSVDYGFYDCEEDDDCF